LPRAGPPLSGGPHDLLADLGVAFTRAARAPSRPPPDLSAEELRAWEALGDGALPDLVARHLGRSISDAVALLIGLELRGLVRSVGGRYERTAGA
jgi:predicted Rossmann fold nucleotide-binding protein DprA/Smf involved in DNA uptake